jgi:quercetin dioxygenase-like cupin family protein
MIRPHQPGQSAFRSVLPEDIDWKPFPAFPPSVRLAVVVGDPAEPGPYVIRVKVPSGVRLMPHKHPEDRSYTVMSGVFYIGPGDRFDGVAAYPPGSVIVLPGDTPHFHCSKSGKYITQVTAVGPLGLEYPDPCEIRGNLDVSRRRRENAAAGRRGEAADCPGKRRIFRDGPSADGSIEPPRCHSKETVCALAWSC